MARTAGEMAANVLDQLDQAIAVPLNVRGPGPLLPEDFVTTDTGRERGINISVRIPPEYMYHIDRLLLMGTKLSAFPRTKSDFFRNALVWYTRRLIEAGVLQPDNIHDIEIVRDMLIEEKMNQMMMAHRQRLQQNDKVVDTFIEMATELILGHQFDFLQQEADKFFALMREYVKASPEKGQRMVKRFHQSPSSQNIILSLKARGHECDVPSL